MSTPITAYVGLNGSGKTLCMVEDLAVPALHDGVPVWGTVNLRPERIGCDPSLFHPLTSWRDVPTLSGCVLLLDEISTVLPSRQSASAPAGFIATMQQLRKRDVRVGWSSPAWPRADKSLRECTGEVVLCRGLLADRWLRDDAGAVARDDDGNRVRAAKEWRPNRLFVFKRYSAEDYEEFTLDKARKLRPMGRRRYWRPRGEAHRVYETLEQVFLLDHLDDVGQCINCGGARKRLPCTCSDYLARTVEARSAATVRSASPPRAAQPLRSGP